MLVNNSQRRGSIYFAYSANSAIIYYIHGGKGAHTHIYIVGINDNKKNWHKNILPLRHKNLIELQQILKNKEYSEAIKDDV